MLNFRLFFWPVLILLLIRSGVELYLYNFRIVDNDQSLYWLAVHDLTSGNSIPAFVYGQDYNYFIEPWLAALPVFIGVRPEYALPVVTLLMALAPFLAFAFAARLKQLHGGALLWLLVPLLLPSGWFIITAMPRGFVNGLFLFTALPFIQRIRRESLKWLLSGVLFASAVAINPNTFPLVVCCGVLELLLHYKRVAFYSFHLIGAAPVLGAHYLITQHIQQQPGGLLHPKWGLEWTFDYFAEGFTHIHQWLHWIVPGNAGVWLLLPVIVVFLWVVIYQRRWNLLIVCLLIIITLILSLGVNKLHDGREHLHYPFSRMWLSLPIIIALLAERIRFPRIILAPLFTLVLGLSIFSLGAPSATNQATELPLRLIELDILRKNASELHILIEHEQPNAVVGLGYPVWVGDQQLLFHYTEVSFPSSPLFIIPDYERRRERTLLPIKGKILLLGGDEEKWEKYGNIQYKVAVAGMNGSVVEP